MPLPELSFASSGLRRTSRSGNDNYFRQLHRMR